MTVESLRTLALTAVAAWALAWSSVPAALGSEAADEDYESAEYKVIESEGKFEIREYPDLMLAAITSKVEDENSGGGFMKLFRYISGANESKQKIAMTTPVFMESQGEGDRFQMGFVMPKEVAVAGVPKPNVAEVNVRKRAGGRFAVVRLPGDMTAEAVDECESGLRAWMKTKGVEADEAGDASGVETAVYDSPFTPIAQRRNELLVRLKASQ